MAYTSPANWSPGEVVLDTKMNAQIRDNWLATFGTNGQLVSPIVGSGGLQVSAGNLSIGGTPSSFAAIDITASLSSALTQAEGILIRPTLTASANSDALSGLNVGATYNTNGKTGVSCYAISINGPVATGASQAYSLIVAAPSGASGSNIAVYVTGGGITIGAGGLTVTGTTTLTGALNVTGDIIGTGDMYAASATTGMTAGFVRISAANGAPTGTVSSVSGRAAIYYDAGADRLYVWNGVWKKTAVGSFT